jgi:hypothetical protein
MTQGFSKTRVECYSGYRGDELPRRFEWTGHEIDVAYIIERWTEPQYRYFKVCGNDGDVYQLRFDSVSGVWESKKTE